MAEEIIKRQLTIRSYHCDNVELSDSFSFKKNENNDFWTMQFDKNYLKNLLKEYPLVKDVKLQIIKPNDDHHIHINSVMDFIPISTKALGIIGEGITNTITGAYIMMTGVDTKNRQVCAFGNSDGFLDEQVKFNQPGTPADDDIIIWVDFLLEEDAGMSRPGPDSCHYMVDRFSDEIRVILKKVKGDKCNEKNIYYDVEKPGKKRVAIVKLVSGQGAMYDTHFMAKEPSGFIDSRSIIDIEGAPIILSPNEYRDGALRCLYG